MLITMVFIYFEVQKWCIYILDYNGIQCITAVYELQVMATGLYK